MKKLFISCLTAVLSIGLFAVSTVNAASDVSQLLRSSWMNVSVMRLRNSIYGKSGCDQRIF